MRSVSAMNAMPSTIPSSSPSEPRPQPSTTSTAVAASMAPAAAASAIPSRPRSAFGLNRKGSAPSPHASAVRSAAIATVNAFTLTRHLYHGRPGRDAGGFAAVCATCFCGNNDPMPPRAVDRDDLVRPRQRARAHVQRRQEHDLHFNFVHEKDGSRIGYEKICKKEGVPVPDDEIVKAYEYEKGEWVYLSDEDFQAAQVQGHRTFDISDFVSSDDIDPIFFESTYYLGPQEGAEKVYALLARALDESGLAGVGTFVMRDREHLGALRVRDGVITLERMYFADEIREPDGVKPKGVRVEKRELEMAMELIDRFSGEWKPEKYKDTYRDTLMKIIEQKRKGKKVHVETTPEPEETVDLMEALRQSLEAAKAASPRRASAPRPASARRRASRARRRAGSNPALCRESTTSSHFRVVPEHGRSGHVLRDETVTFAAWRAAKSRLPFDCPRGERGCSQDAKSRAASRVRWPRAARRRLMPASGSPTSTSVARRSR